MTTKNNLFKLRGKIQHYQWGGYYYLPELLRIPNPDHKPYAEYWMGGHENAPAAIIMDDKQVPLNQYIQSNPQEVLGEKVYKEFKRLPYLLKILDVKDMLSIQVHPSKESAVIEFERENRLGIPLNAPDRNYKDDNHKPELMVALGDFWLLHGFKSPAKIKETIESIPEFAFMAPLFNNGDYKKLYSVLMEMDQQQVNRILQPVLERIEAAYAIDYLPKGSAHFWAARAAATFNEPGKIDRGIFSIYLLNLVHLNPGEAVFQDAGTLHAYLEGQNIEIMANSDNVLRGGLTPKHVDVTELIKQVNFMPIIPHVIHAVRVGNEDVFNTPAKDFRLSRYEFGKDESVSLQTSTTDIFLLLEGEVELKEKHSCHLEKGEAAIAFAGTELTISAPEKAVLYRATAAIS